MMLKTLGGCTDVGPPELDQRVEERRAPLDAVYEINHLVTVKGSQRRNFTLSRGWRGSLLRDDLQARIVPTSGMPSPSEVLYCRP